MKFNSFTSSTHFKFGVSSDAGAIRDSNQDSAFAGKNFLLVADGMGGHAGGDVASTITVTILSQLNEMANPHGFTRKRLMEKEAISLLEQSIIRTYLAIIESVKENDELAGMGTTLTSILRTENSYVIAHLGDSRAYLLQNNELARLTDDHTFVQHLVDSGKITNDEAKVHPQRNVVMRVLGDFEVDLDPDISTCPIIKGDRYLLCSDGVCGVLADEDIQRILIACIDPQDAADKLVSRAIEEGSTDNCTAVVADVVSEHGNSTESNTPIFAGAAHESLQDYLNDIVQRTRDSVLTPNNFSIDDKAEPSNKRWSIFNFFHRNHDVGLGDSGNVQ